MKNILGDNNVIGGVAAISALIEEPGIIRHNSPMQMLKFGEFSNEKTERVIAFQSACEKAGINNAIPDNINTDMWQKNSNDMYFSWSKLYYKTSSREMPLKSSN